MAQQKTIKELETKHAKLKFLLARTHSASKQQMEDSYASRRAQTVAVEELREKEQEKSDLQEQLQALDIQHAFTQDIEIYTQKVAEDLLLTKKKEAAAILKEGNVKMETNERTIESPPFDLL